MYKCDQCGEVAKIETIQSIDQYDDPCENSMIVCSDCGYTISKDTADRNSLLNVCKQTLEEFEYIYGDEIYNISVSPVALIRKLEKCIKLAETE